MVPIERKLEFRLGDGWEPLCKFLGVEVPDVPFPRVNDREEHRARQAKEMKALMGQCFATLRPWIVGFLGVGILASWLARR